MAIPSGPVDVHGHAMPWGVLRWLEEGGLADLSGAEEGVARIDSVVSGVGPGAPLPLSPSMTDPALRVLELDAMGLAAQAISLPPFLMASRSVDGALVREVVRRGNDALAEYCADDDRLIPLGLVPVGFEDAGSEARRCLDDLGMAGIALGSRGAGVDLDHAVNDGLWDLLGERRAFVLLHPSATPDPARLADYWFPQLVGYPMETAIAAARLVFSGTLEGRPLALCLAHGGGCLPSLRGRLDLGWSRKEPARTIDRPPSEAFAELYYDTAVYDPIALTRLVEDVGASQVLLGTDHPFDLAEHDPIGFVGTARLTADERHAILETNARHLLHLSE
jgi:aminocarboxymuconate-semialdehyde decarboxylase